MNDLHKYFYSVVAACFIALGSGFISTSQYSYSTEKEAYKLVYELEQKEKIKFTKNTKCETLKNNIGSCKYAIYLLNSNIRQIELVRFIANLIVGVLFIFLFAGVWFHRKQIITSKG